MSAPIETDVSRRSALARATLAPASRSQHQALLDKPSEEYLDAVEEEWNKRLDSEVEVLVEGMADLVSIASIGEKDKFQIAQEAFQAQCRAESMVRAANTLLSLTHSLKLMLLVGDEAQLVRQRNEELTRLRADIETYKTQAANSVDALLHEEVFQGPEDEDTQATLVESANAPMETVNT